MKKRGKVMGASHSYHCVVTCRTGSSAAAPAASSSNDYFPIILDILEEIFLNVPAHQVVCLCRLVCRQWKEVADSKSFWIRRCRRERYEIRDASNKPKDWRLFYFLCKKRRNLLKNPRGEEELSGWEILLNGGDKWAVERVLAPHPNGAQKNFVTSYHMCKKSQLIDLEKEGYNASFMDHYQPDIKISDWYASRRGCGCLYTMSVQLLNKQKRVVQKFDPDTVCLEGCDDGQWKQMTHVFKNYGPGVRFIEFVHGGQDTLYWAGWYGIRITDSSVEICPAKDA
ncbi:F-box only protein 6-like [Mugil cephalus]|uniref:F-box only protein 6-like n=1 Tax=Mugil cephalus TaxID=48193 RepID=UPI001FB81038|nr:F-box only protein 6-like [Mugil cephalus]